MIKRIKDNIFKGFITSIIGIITMIISLYLLIFKQLIVWPDFIIVMGIGTLLLIAPKSIENIIINFLSKKS